MKERLFELNPWWSSGYELKGIAREKYLIKLNALLDKKDVVVLTGLRRVGKTTLLKQVIFGLLKKGIDSKYVCFISLDLLYFQDYSIQDIVLEYKKIHKIKNTEKVYLFLDEVSYKANFNQELKNLYDLGNYKVYASSSSAKALKDNKAFLTGRARYLEVYPLDFAEFVLFRGVDFKSADLHILSALFDEYLFYGGMPEYVLEKDELYLSELSELIISKDIIAANNLKNTQIVFDLFRLLCERVGKQISYNNISKILSIDNETVSRYVSYFLDTYLFDLIEVKDKLNVQIRSKKKMYCGDVGLRNVVTGFRYKGAIYENLVYNKLKKTSSRINFLYEKGVEIDFITSDLLVEAKYGYMLTEKQQKLFDSVRGKIKKIVAQGVDFFLE